MFDDKGIGMDDIKWQLFLEHRERRANEFEASIQQPGPELSAFLFDSSDRDALALAIRRCDPTQVAEWIIELVTEQVKPLDDEEPFCYEENEDWRADDSEPRP